MVEQQSPVEQQQKPSLRALRRRRPTHMATMLRRLGLKLVTTEALTIRRRRSGKGFCYIGPDGAALRDQDEIRRLASLAVPPAYQDVLYAQDPAAHLQAIGRDAAGRLQYRYHPEWEKVRETHKARRLARLVGVLPKIRRSIGRYLAATELSRELVLAAVIELVARSGIRPGSESYARMRGTRGAATLLKSNVAVEGEMITLAFRGKGGKVVRKTFSAPRLGAVIEALRTIPGRRLFQYLDTSGAARPISARDVNEFLREIAGIKISLKDFRTLLASAGVLEALAQQSPAQSARQRRRQVLEAVRVVADELANTPAVCRRSYVHSTVVTAFEEGVLENFADLLKRSRSVLRREQILGRVLAIASEPNS